MSVESLAAVLHHSRAKGTAKLVLVGIANHDGDGGAWPTIRTLAKYANVTPRNVQKSLEKLVSLGELTIAEQAGGLSGLEDWERPNLYHVTVTCPPWCDRTHQHRDTRQTRQPGLVPGVAGDRGGVSLATGEGVSLATGEGVSLATPKPSTKPIPTEVSTQVQYAREACAVCSARDELVCADRQRRLAKLDRHTYTPVVRHASG